VVCDRLVYVLLGLAQQTIRRSGRGRCAWWLDQIPCLGMLNGETHDEK
jgi:hypothetical protein